MPKAKAAPAKKSPAKKSSAAPKVTARTAAKTGAASAAAKTSAAPGQVAKSTAPTKVAAAQSAPKAEAKSEKKSSLQATSNATSKSLVKTEAKSASAKNSPSSDAKKTDKPTLKKSSPLRAVKHAMPAPPSSRMTLMKLGFSPTEQAAILAAPHGFKIPGNAAEPATLNSQYDFILIFVENITEAEVVCASLNPSLRPKGRAWVAWPKGGASDIDLNQLAGMVEAEGLQKITSLSLDERWSAVKFMHPKADR